VTGELFRPGYPTHPEYQPCMEDRRLRHQADGATFVQITALEVGLLDVHTVEKIR
jgi:hypothetical protein